VTHPASVTLDPHQRKRRWGLSIIGLTAFVVAGASLSLGAVAIPFGDVVDVFGARFGFDRTVGQLAESVVWGLRVPRLLMAVVVGGALAICGATLQGMLRNKLADPHLLGIGPGAAIGGAIGSSLGGIQGSIAGGVAAGVLAAFIVRSLKRRATVDQHRLILSGVALGVALSAWAGFVVFGSDRSVVPPIEFWILGSLGGSTWRGLATTLVFVTLGVLVIWGMRRTLDLLLLGESAAWNLGVDVEMVSTVLLIVIGVVVGATVGAVGVVVFVGLLVPFVMRPITGPVHGKLLVGSAVGGSLFLSASDLAARLVISPIEVPVGLVTSVIGGPIFLWLLARRRDV
jgi:iron complex transport system permease protein